MGNCENCPYKINDANMYAAEEKILKMTGIPYSEFKIEDVYIDSKDFVRTISVGDPKKQPMVLVHGYGGCGVMFFKILKYLTKYFYVIMID